MFTKSIVEWGFENFSYIFVSTILEAEKSAHYISKCIKNFTVGFQSVSSLNGGGGNQMFISIW